MDEREWNALMSEINQQERALQQMRVNFGWEKEETGKGAEADGSRKSTSAAGRSRTGTSRGQTRDTVFHSARTSPGKTEASNSHGGGTISIAPGIQNHGKKPETVSTGLMCQRQGAKPRVPSKTECGSLPTKMLMGNGMLPQCS